MRQELTDVRSERMRLLSAAAEGVSKLKQAPIATPVYTEILKHLSYVRRGARSLTASSGVLMLIAALRLSAAFEAPYALRMALLVSFVFAFSLWAARDLMPDDTPERPIIHEQIGFALAAIVLAIGAAGDFILRSANIWLLASLAILISSKSILSAHRSGKGI